MCFSLFQITSIRLIETNKVPDFFLFNNCLFLCCLLSFLVYFIIKRRLNRHLINKIQFIKKNIFFFLRGEFVKIN